MGWVERTNIGATLAHAIHRMNLDRCRIRHRPWSQHARQVNLVPGKYVHRNLARQRRARRRSADDERSGRSRSLLHASGKGRRSRGRCRGIRWRLRVALNSDQPCGTQHDDAQREIPARFRDSSNPFCDAHKFLSPSDVRSLTNVSSNRPAHVLHSPPRAPERGDDRPDVRASARCGGVHSIPGNERP